MSFNRKAVEESVRLDGAMLGHEETARGIVCPSCHGGQSGEATFTITRVEHGLVYNCYRSTCEARGFVPTSGLLVQPSKPKDPRDSLRPYWGEYWPISVADAAYFKRRFGLEDIPDYAIGVNEQDKYVFQVKGHDSHRVRGYLVRNEPWKLPTGQMDPSYPRAPIPSQKGSKSALYMHAVAPTQSWYVPDTYAVLRDTVVLVEDHVSALKVRQAGFTGVALIGTNLDELKVREIAQFRPREVIIALDKDATSTAFKHARRWGLAFPKVRVSMLDGDIKDTDPQNVKEVLGL